MSLYTIKPKTDVKLMNRMLDWTWYKPDSHALMYLGPAWRVWLDGAYETEFLLRWSSHVELIAHELE